MLPDRGAAADPFVCAWLWLCVCVRPQLSLRPELRARCMVQSRLNYLLPAFAAEGLLVAALHAEARRAASRRGDAGHW